MATLIAGMSAVLNPPISQQTLPGSSVVGVLPCQQMDYWPTTQNPLYSFSSAHSERSPYAQQQYKDIRQSLYSLSRNSNPLATTEGLPYDINLPPFPTSMDPSSGQQKNLLIVAPQQQQQQMDTNSRVNSQQPSPQPSQHSSLHTPDNCGGRYSLIQTYRTPSSTPQQSSFPAAYTQLPPSQQSLNKPSAHSNRTSSMATNSHSSTIAQQSSQPRPHSGYSLTSTQGPVIPDVQRLESQMERMGCMNIQNPPQMGTPVQEQQPQQKQPSDRPFKCDQCPQSFNRNHDLKRHKRIHLELKPFPCGHCEKSFSRKDALKRHTLVKGCGKSGGDERSNETKNTEVIQGI
ncbi:hypothetical protein IFR05_014437 [Cadophora sp. M221]|nr:hypothetical protein IFR05_014437 [Cadophora sp. M221]